MGQTFDDLQDNGLLTWDRKDLPLLNRIARALYTIRGYGNTPEGYDFSSASHPHECEAFYGACVALNLIREEDE